MADISSLYPAPPQQNALASNPGAVINLMQSVNALRAKQAVGQAFQGAIGTNGEFDPSAAAIAIKNDQNATFGAPEAVGSILDARIRNNEVARGTLGINLTQNEAARNIIAGLADNADGDTVRNIVPQLTRAGISPQVAEGWGSYINSDPKTRADKIRDQRNIAAGAATTMQQIGGPPGANLQPTTQTLGSAQYPGAGAQRVIGAMPGQVGQVEAARAQITADQGKSTQILGNLRNMEAALPLARKLSDPNFGPDSEGWTKWRSRAAELGLISDTTKDAVGARQELGAKLLAYAGQRPIAERSDAALANIVSSKPDPGSMVKPAVLDLIRKQAAMDKVDAAMPTIHQSGLGGHIPGGAAPPGIHPDATYNNYRSNYYNYMDDRAAELPMMNATEQTNLKKSLGDKNGPQYQKFMKTYNALKRSGAITPGQAE